MTLSWRSTALDALVASNEVRAATLEAAVPAFCAGADLKVRAEIDPDGMSAHSQLISTCAGKRPALGGGLERAVQLYIGHNAVPADAVDEAGLALARQLASFPPKSVRALRELLASLHSDEVRAGMVRARAVRDRLNADAEVQGVLRAFRQQT